MNNDANFQNNKFWAVLSLLGMILGAIAIIVQFKQVLSIPVAAIIFMLLGFGLAVIFNLIMFRVFIVGFLLSLFFTLIAARIAALYNFYLFSAPLVFSAIIFIILYWHNAIIQLSQQKITTDSVFRLTDYQLTFLRIYVGMDFIPHFTEKLLAGPMPRLADVQAFTHLGIPHPEFFVILAGLCELGAAIALGLGLITRLGALFAGLYLLIATYLGNHFILGFIWASPGGGWEYPLMWLVLTLIFAISGAGQFSLDYYINSKYKLPKFIRCLQGQS